MRAMSFVCVCLVALSVSSSYAGMRFSVMPGREVRDLPAQGNFIKTTNNPLKQAMDAHNLLTEIPAMETLSESLEFAEKNLSVLNKTMKNLKKCGELALGGNYKNSDVVLDKAVKEYQQEVEKVEEEYESLEDEDSIIPVSILVREQLDESKKKINRNIFRNIAKNPKKYGAELINPKAARAKASEEDENEPTMNVLDSIVQSGNALHNAELGKKDILKTQQEIIRQFRENLAKLGLVYNDLDLTQRAGLLQVRSDLKKVKETALQEAEVYIAQLNAQDAEHPDLVAKRAYRSKAKQQALNRIQSSFPEMMKGMVLVSQITPQQQQALIMDALKRDAEGKVYLTETNIVDLDRKMKEMDAHNDLMDYFKGIADDKIPTDVPEFDFSQCKA
ncbi:MAG: hypothetical protein J6Y85_00645 [Alphaproteobacteria bacterium]|nr:hypothetical protein [Alphaproteobacteria bacterium]